MRPVPVRSDISVSVCALYFTLLLCVCGMTMAALAQSPAPAKFSSASLTQGAAKWDSTVLSLGTGDFNGDGKRDLIVISENTAANLLLGNGDGTFAAPTAFPLYVRSGWDGVPAHNPNLVAVGDFNGGGKLDFAVYITGNSNYLDVYLGDGTGNFTYSNNYTVGTAGKGGGGGNSVVAVDVNGDGKLDLVATNQADNTVTVLLGNGDGTFQNGVLYPACNFGGCSVINLTIGDFNKDGYPDLALPDYGSGGGMDILLKIC